MKEQINPCYLCKHEDKSTEQRLLCNYYEDGPDKVNSPCAIKYPCFYDNKSMRDILFCPHFESDPNEDDLNKGNPPCAGNYYDGNSVAKALDQNLIDTFGGRIGSSGRKTY